MSPNDDVYRKVGRGGAGNFYSKPTTSDDANKDLEAQNPESSTIPVPLASNPAVAGQYTRAGRGGAGNYVDPSTAREQQNAEETLTAKAAANVTPKVVNRMALGGRGGAGNYHQKAQEEAEKEAEKAQAEALDKKAREEVDEDLKMPGKAVLAGNHN
ncbi:hypothetical protein NLU13_2684 [Sarocladium strictum]|uniref:Uncharacterized protein n=1 Tax=Sarocladium strictum TaxID=5046 RepID=A0AA39GMF3_SARSR|nr:hypothetical protein NLU13_2684 [Sarocladium strictum]